MQQKEKIIFALVGVGIVLTATLLVSRTFVKTAPPRVPGTPGSTASSSTASGKNSASAEKEWSAEDFRLANLSLGMTEKELFRLMGQPKKVTENAKGRTKFMVYPGVQVYTKYFSSKGLYLVTRVIADSTAYPSFRGIKVGATLDQVTTVYGTPDRSQKALGVYYENNTLESGSLLELSFQLNKDTVVSISAEKRIDWVPADFMLNGVSVGMKESEVVQALGVPANMKHDGTALIYEYPGLTVKFSDWNGNFSVEAVVVTTPDFPTARGIKVGDTREQVEEIYPAMLWGNGDEAGVLEFQFNSDNTVSSILLFPQAFTFD